MPKWLQYVFAGVIGFSTATGPMVFTSQKVDPFILYSSGATSALAAIGALRKQTPGKDEWK